jgi:hypothetical protein
MRYSERTMPVKRHQVLFMISFILVAVAIILLIVLSVQIRRISVDAVPRYDAPPVRITSSV